MAQILLELERRVFMIGFHPAAVAVASAQRSLLNQ